MTRHPRLAACALITALSATAAASGPSGPSFDLPRSTIDGGGGSTGGGTYTLYSVVGQHDAGIHAGGTFSLAGGLLVSAAVDIPCLSDIEGDGTVDFGDLYEIVIAWGPCPPGDCPADLNGNGDVDFADIIVLTSTPWGPCP